MRLFSVLNLTFGALNITWCVLVAVSILIFSVPGANAASVTEWGASRADPISSQIVGRWQLIAIYENGDNISAEKSLKEYWVFKDNGWVEHFEEPFGLRRSTYSVSGRALTVKPKNHKEGIRRYSIKYVDKEKMIWRLRDRNITYTYNLIRY
ncbi:MAG: lipocalin family protein [Pseudomonadales bacterium]|nr:lipocalin family protein [Pseudomonadales bacterium]